MLQLDNSPVHSKEVETETRRDKIIACVLESVLTGNWELCENILFPETRAITRACAATHASKFTCAIYCTCEIIVFSRKEKFFIEEFSIEHN